MFRSLSLFLVAGILIASSSVRADSDYQRKLDALNQTVEVEFSSILPFVKKAEGVNQLYRLVFESGPAIGTYFKKDGVIQKVIIYEAIGTDPQSVASRSLLRRNTIIFDYTGSDSETLFREAPTFLGELQEIQAVEQRLTARIPNLFLDRTLSLIGKVTNPNRTYLENIRNLDTILTKDSRYSTPISAFGRIWIEDSASGYAATTIQTFSYQTVEDGHVTSKAGLLLRFAREGFYQERSRVTAEMIQQLLDVVLIHGFAQIDYLLLSEEEVRTLFSDFTHFLTPERIAVLKARGIHRFYFTGRWEKEEELIHGDRLTLGITQADMERVYALLFGG